MSGGQRFIDDLVVRDRDDERLYGMQDSLWSVVAVADHSGAIKVRQTYSSYGTQDSWDDTFAPSPANQYTLEYAFTGRLCDTNTYILGLRTRYLHTSLGCMLSRDPIEYSGGFSLYAYAHSSPCNYIDPSGLLCLEVSRTPLVNSIARTNVNIPPMFFVQGQLGVAAELATSICHVKCNCERSVDDLQVTLSLSAFASAAGGVGYGIKTNWSTFSVFGYIGIKLAGTASVELTASGSTDRCHGVSTVSFGGCFKIPIKVLLSGGGSIRLRFGYFAYDVAAEVFGEWQSDFAKVCYTCTVPGGCSFDNQLLLDKGHLNAGFRFCFGPCASITLQ